MKKNQASAIVISNDLVFVFYILAAVLSTLFLAHNQIIVGTVVNSLLFFTASNIEKRYHWLVAVFPSILALFQGFLFGSFTIFLAYFLPFIWVGNYLLMTVSEKFKKNSNIALFVSPVVKSLFLFSIAFILVNTHFVPRIFLTSMGIFQLLTAVFGGILFIIVNKLVNVR